MFLGYYNLANLITLAGLAASVTAVVSAGSYDFRTAIFMLTVAGFCDMCDGLVARNNYEKYDDKTHIFGSTLDTLCSLVGFVIAPVTVAYFFGNRTSADIFIYIVYAVCGVIHLANHSTAAALRGGRTSAFRGVPIATVVAFLPVIFALAMFASPSVTGYMLRILFLCLSVGFVVNIRVKRPSIRTIAIVAIVCLFCLAMMTILRDIPIKYFTYAAFIALPKA